MQVYLELSRHIFIRDIRELINTIIKIELMLSNEDPDYIDTVLLYLLSVRDDLPTETLKTELSKEGRKRLMSIAERLRSEGMKEGVKEGMKEGIKEGELKKSREIAKNLLRLNVDKKKIMEATTLPAEEIERIKNDMQ